MPDVASPEVEQGPPTLSESSEDTMTPLENEVSERLPCQRRLEVVYTTLVSLSETSSEPEAVARANDIRTRMEIVLRSYEYEKSQGDDPEKIAALELLANKLADRGVDIGFALEGGQTPKSLEQDVKYHDDADDPTEVLVRLPTDEFIHSKEEADSLAQEGEGPISLTAGGVNEEGSDKFIVDSELTSPEQLLAVNAVLVEVKLHDFVGKLVQKYGELSLNGESRQLRRVENYLNVAIGCKDFFDRHYGPEGLGKGGSPDKLEANAYYLLLNRTVEEIEKLLQEDGMASDSPEAAESDDETQEMLAVKTREFNEDEAAELAALVEKGREQLSDRKLRGGFLGVINRAVRWVAEADNKQQPGQSSPEEAGAVEGEAAELHGEDVAPEAMDWKAQYEHDLNEVLEQRAALLEPVGGDLERLTDSQRFILETYEDDIAYYQEQLGVDGEEVAKATIGEQPLDEFTMARRERLNNQAQELAKLRDAMLEGDPNADTEGYDTSIQGILGEIREIDEKTAA